MPYRVTSTLHISIASRIEPQELDAVLNILGEPSKAQVKLYGNIDDSGIISEFGLDGIMIGSSERTSGMLPPVRYLTLPLQNPPPEIISQIYQRMQDSDWARHGTGEAGDLILEKLVWSIPKSVQPAEITLASNSAVISVVYMGVEPETVAKIKSVLNYQTVQVP